jgi:hypothetical protein
MCDSTPELQQPVSAVSASDGGIEHVEWTPKVRQGKCGQFLEQSFCREFPPVSASFRRADWRKPAAAAHVEML